MQDTSKNKSGDRLQFLILEHSSLQEKIRHASTDLYRTETIVPVAIGLIYVWLYDGQRVAGSVPQWAWWIPAIIASFGAIRQRLRYKSLWAHHRYVQKIEREFHGNPPVSDDDRPYGWETHWLSEANRFVRIFKSRFSLHGLMRIVFWIMVVGGTVVLAVQKTILGA